MGKEKTDVTGPEADAEQAERDADYTPSRSTYFTAAVIAVVIDAIRGRAPFVRGDGFAPQLAMYVIAMLSAFALVTVLLRLVKKPRLSVAAKYSAAMMVGFTIGDVFYSVLVAR